MSQPIIIEAAIDYGKPIGTYTYKYHTTGASIGGKPFPSEGQAWAFQRGLQILTAFMSMRHEDQLSLIKQLKL